MSFLDFLAIIAGNAIGVLIVHWIGALVRRPGSAPVRAIAPTPVTLAPPSGGAVWPAIAAVPVRFSERSGRVWAY